LIVDIAAPEYETKVAILRKKAEERDQEFELSVAEALAKHPLSSVRQLAGALNKVLAIQEPEEAPVEGPITGQQLLDEFGSFMEELSHTVAHKVEREEEPWRRLLRETAEIFEKDGVSATRLRRILESDTLPADPQEVADQFRRDVARLRQVEKSLATAGNPWPEAAVCVLKDPERLDEAVSLLASAQERVRPFSRLGEGPFLANLESHYEAVVIKAAGKLITEECPEYNPLYIAAGLGWRGQEGLKQYPDAGATLVNTGAVLEHRGDGETAKGYYERAISGDSPPPQAYKALGDQGPGPRRQGSGQAVLRGGPEMGLPPR
jgi:hypothetical protein